jgi:hypothetical protein
MARGAGCVLLFPHASDLGVVAEEGEDVEVKEEVEKVEQRISEFRSGACDVMDSSYGVVWCFSVFSFSFLSFPFLCLLSLPHPTASTSFLHQLDTLL